MYIANPLKSKKQRKLSDLTSTHPPISERIKILRNMSRGASFKDYSDSYSQTVGDRQIMPASALKESETVELRQADAKAKKQASAKKQMRQVGDIMRRVNQFVFLTCACGLQMKIPPNFKSNKVSCPRCKRKLDVPKAG